MLPRILRYDLGRIKAYKAKARRGNDPEFHTELARVVRRAWTWNAIRLPSLLVRRRRVQNMATARDDVQRFILPGLNEGGHQGDVDSFYDAFSARPVSAIRMGQSDRGSLGSGWHGVEQPAGAAQPYRWCKARSWFYLEPKAQDRRLVLKVASPIAPNALTLFADDHLVGEARVDGDVTEPAFELPTDLPRTRLWEFRLECAVVRPADRSPGGDIRDLGLTLFEMRLE